MKSVFKGCILVCMFLAGVCLFWISNQYFPVIPEKPIVVIIPSYNNSQWCQRNIASVLDQQYRNYRVIYIDDCSSDDTYEKVKKHLQDHEMREHVSVIHNFERKGALANIYHAIMTCDNHEIVIIVDGDDWITHPYVFQIINKMYADPNVWMTYGQWIDYPLQRTGISVAFPTFYVTHNAFRFYSPVPGLEFPVSHLRTFYGFLGKAVKKEDLKYDGLFYQMSGDKALLCPLIEMAATHARYVPDYLYVYNTANQLNDYKRNVWLQMHLHYHILRRTPYEPLKR